MDQHKTDDNLRYVGGLTRVLAADASISFAAGYAELINTFYSSKEIFLCELISDTSYYADLFKEKLEICLDKEDEMDCLVAGSNFLLKAVHTKAFTYMDGQKEFVQIDHDDLYPYMLVNIGSGVSMIKVDGHGKFEQEEPMLVATPFGVCNMPILAFWVVMGLIYDFCKFQQAGK
ncbi:unnamed protein product [Prunus armeniaca]